MAKMQGKDIQLKYLIMLEEKIGNNSPIKLFGSNKTVKVTKTKDIQVLLEEINKAKKREVLEYIEKNPAMFAGVDGAKFAQKTKADAVKKLLSEFVEPEKILKETNKAVYTEMSGWVGKSI